MNVITLESLLHDSKHIIDQDIQDRKARGEDFNIFSVLGMETNETRTHSKMLVALLNPKENHYFEDTFLKLFLDKIGYDYEDEDLKRATVQAEYHLGRIDKAYDTGGFIDILVLFSSGKTIAIENKIYAGDQRKQMYRYSLHNKGQTTLYYLNLYGEPPSPQSIDGLELEDFRVISYTDEILKWLDKCLNLKEMNSSSIIYNSIKQYQILLKRLTHTMEDTLEKELKDAILNNLEAAKFVNFHYQKVVDEVREKFRKAVYEKFTTLHLGLDVHLGLDSSNQNSQIWIDTLEFRKRDIRFGIESFSGKGNNDGRLFVGIFNKQKICDNILSGDRRLNIYWPVIREIKTTKNNYLNLSSSKILEDLNKEADYFIEMVDTVVEQVVVFLNDYEAEYLRS
ncbi:MAG: PD-(D/E)XK nuclease family protein [Gelidibacter sp.]